MGIKNFIVLLFILLLSSCASRNTYHAILGSWVGSSESELVKSWGEPLKSYSQDGSKFLVYDKGGAGSGGYHRTAVVSDCTTTFEVVDDTIIGSDFEGICRAR